MNTLSAEQLHILQHSLGLDYHGRGSQYRNRFITGEGTTDWTHCRTLVDLGFMKDYGPQPLAAGDHFFCVTDIGKKAVRDQSPVAKRTRQNTAK